MKKLVIRLASHSYFRSMLNRWWHPNGVRIVCFHSISRNNRVLPNWLCVSPENFEEQVKMLAENFNVVTFRELESKISLKNKLIITFDDGLRDNYQAAQILAKYNLKAVFFVNPPVLEAKMLWIHKLYYACSKIGIKNLVQTLEAPSDINDIKGLIDYLKANVSYVAIKNLMHKIDLNYPKNFYLTREELKDLDSLGMELASHGVSHFPLTRVHGVSDEGKSDFLLGEITHKKIEAFAYPFGEPASFNEQTDAVLLEKYQYICTTIPKVNIGRARQMGRVCSYEMNPIKLYLKLIIGY